MSGLPSTEGLARLFERVSHQTLYDVGRSGKFTRDRLKEVSRKDKLTGGMVTTGARAVIPDRLLDTILPIFRDLLRDFVDRGSDRIGNGLVNLAGGALTPVLRDYVPILIRAAAVLGGQRVAELLTGWIQGERVKYHTISLINGATIDRSLVLEEGLRLYQLPQSSNEVVSHLPAMSLDMLGFQAMIGRVALSIEGEAGPALFLPSRDAPDPNHNMENVWAGGQIEKLSIGSFCEAMSLACGGSIRWQLFWRDFGEISEFLSVNGGTSYNLLCTNLPHFTTSSGFTQDHFEHARKIHNQRNQKGRSKAGLDMAVRRWIKSKFSESSFSDQLIDLRIALEALYLDNNEGELRFRLASLGAWHISENMAERKANLNTLLQVYKLASSAVHGKDVKRSDKNEAFLENAQTLCRKGIMKRLREQENPQWNDIIRGDDG